MSLYNALFGVNVHAPMLLSFLGTTADRIPRFRDCYAEDGKIVVYTRMGGGNRGHWDYSDAEEGPECDCPGCIAENYLPTLPGYSGNEDDDFDCTYASYYYQPSAEVAELVEQLSALDKTSPADRWQKLFADMAANRDNPQVARAIEVCKPIIEAISASFASAGEAGTADTPQSESVHEHATAGGGDAQPSATPPSSGTQS